MVLLCGSKAEKDCALKVLHSVVLWSQYSSKAWIREIDPRLWVSSLMMLFSSTDEQKEYASFLLARTADKGLTLEEMAQSGVISPMIALLDGSYPHDQYENAVCVLQYLVI